MRIPNQSADQILGQVSGFYPIKWLGSTQAGLGIELSKKSCNCGCASCQGQKPTIVQKIG